MNYRTIFLKDALINISSMAKYIIEETNEYAIVEFDDDGVFAFFEDFKSAFDLIMSKLKEFDTIDCVGEDNYIYIISYNGIEKQNTKSDYSLKKLKKIKTKNYYLCRRVEKFSEKMLSSSGSTNSISHLSFSKYKKYTFVSKENDIAFKYRMKKAKKEGQPIVIYFHGGGACGTDNIKQFYEFSASPARKKLEKYDCTIIIPQTPINRPYGKVNSIDYLHSVKQLTEILTDELKADKNRIYVYGSSFGGFCTWLSAYYYPDYYACAMPLMGQFEECFFDEVDYSKLKNLPLWIGHSSDDDIVDVKQDDIIAKELEKCSGNFRYTRWDKYGHGMANKFLAKENWTEWMFSQSLDKR